ncbi:MAG: glycosyltransferase family 2 protein, partial [Pseudomonadota bacterium]
MGAWQSYRLRLQRKRWRIRAFRKRRELKRVVNRTDQIRPTDLLAFTTLRNEMVRLPFFLNYYREMGINQFLIVDNG